MKRYWFPPFQLWKPLKKKKTSNVRVAAAVGERLRHGLQFDCELLLLWNGNKYHVLKYGRADLLLIDSSMMEKSRTSCEEDSQWLSIDDLANLTGLAHELDIPSVYWIIHDIIDYRVQADIARHFDVVYAASSEIVKELKALDIVAELLPPCIQPALYNPFRHSEDYNSLDINILFDGWCDADKLPDIRNILKTLSASGLHLIDTEDSLPEDSLHHFSMQNIIGRVTSDIKRTLLKYCKSYLATSDSSKGIIAQTWDLLEVTATRVPVVYFGVMHDDDILNELVVECRTVTDVLSQFVHFTEDPLYRSRLAHISWRLTNQKHTYAHRLQSICERIGIHNDWIEYPKVTCISPTYRLDNLQNCIDTYELLNYRNKELILVINSNTPLQDFANLRLPDRTDIKITRVPGDRFAGAALNMGHLMSSGELCFRIDDDDIYEENYILDMVIAASAIDADVFGKHSAALMFENEDEVYAVNNQVEFLIHTSFSLNNRQYSIGGNSVSGTNSQFFRIPYDDITYAAADAALTLQLAEDSNVTCAVMDMFNCIAIRRLDEASHTWKAPREDVVRGRHVIGNLNSLVV